jgi:hypothetical protein
VLFQLRTVPVIEPSLRSWIFAVPPVGTFSAMPSPPPLRNARTVYLPIGRFVAVNVPSVDVRIGRLPVQSSNRMSVLDAFALAVSLMNASATGVPEGSVTTPLMAPVASWITMVVVDVCFAPMLMRSLRTTLD